jgi:hypothetical protein
MPNQSLLLIDISNDESVLCIGKTWVLIGGACFLGDYLHSKGVP